MSNVAFDRWAEALKVVGKLVCEEKGDLVVPVRAMVGEVYLLRCPACSEWITIQRDYRVTLQPRVTVYPEFPCGFAKCRQLWSVQGGFIKNEGKAPPPVRPPPKPKKKGRGLDFELSEL